MLIIHGDNQIFSRDQMLELKAKAVTQGLQIVEFAGSLLTLTLLRIAHESVSLLGKTNSIFIYDLFTSRPSREKKLIGDYLLQNLKSDIYIWESKDVTSQLKEFPLSAVQKFELPRYIFNFLDNISMPSLHQALGSSSPEQLFALLVGHLAKLIMVKEKVGNFPAWQLSKLTKQVSKYSLPQLISMNDQLLNIDYAQKTSASPYDLAASLELWVSRLYDK